MSLEPMMVEASGSFSPPDGKNASTGFSLFGISLAIDAADPSLGLEFRRVFGGQPASGPADLHVRLTASDDRGQLQIVGSPMPEAGEYFLSFASPTVPFRDLGRSDGWHLIGLDPLEGDVFRFRDDICEFRKVHRWPRILSHLIFLRLLLYRPDLMFFHAGSVALEGRGLLISGAKSTGKTTTSCALAARGWTLLGDETAAYAPSRSSLVAFPRPVAIKPGLRAAAVDRKIREIGPAPDEDGVIRLPVSALADPSPESEIPLHDVVFLSGFGPAPALEAIQPGRSEVAALQPLAASLAGSSHMQRVFEMIRILNGVRCWRLTVGDPDETAALIETKLGES